jgi:hypothetical protein
MGNIGVAGWRPFVGIPEYFKRRSALRQQFHGLKLAPQLPFGNGKRLVGSDEIISMFQNLGLIRRANSAENSVQPMLYDRTTRITSFVFLDPDHCF